MKSAYELAMERLNKTEPYVKLDSKQKKQLAELDSRYAARIAGRDVSMKEAIASASAAGDFEKAEQLQRELVAERKSLQTELEEKKQRVRDGKA